MTVPLLHKGETMKKLVIMHTVQNTIISMPPLIEKMYPGVFKVVNVLDDSLLNDIKAEGKLTKSVIERFVDYVLTSKNSGADAILLACSSIGEAGDIARDIIDIPLFKIDEPMAEKAASLGKKILVLGTVKSTLEPTSRLISKKGDVKVDSTLIEGAFEISISDPDRHDEMIKETVERNIDKYDVIVLAQASMSRALDKIEIGKEKVLTSLPLGLEQLKEII